MKILLIPTTDWIRHPIPNRLNFIFDKLAENHEVHVLNFLMNNFDGEIQRTTRCKLHNATMINVKDPSLYYILNSYYHLFVLKHILKKEKIDIIVSANILPAFLVNFVKGDTPLVFDYLDHYEESASAYYPNSFLGKFVGCGTKSIVRYNIKNANSVITVTAEFEAYLRSVGVMNVDVIPNGVDARVFKKIPIDLAKNDLKLKGKVIGYVGSLEYWVDLETVVKALPELDVTLVVVGPELFTDYGRMIKKLAKEIRVGDKIIFTGRIEYSELYRYICAMDICLNPLKHLKKNEITVGGKVFNYLACGKPVLTSRMAALESLLGDNLFYYDDKESFVQMVNLLINQEQEPEKYIKIAKKFDWTAISEKYGRLLERKLNRKEVNRVYNEPVSKLSSIPLDRDT